MKQRQFSHLSAVFVGLLLLTSVSATNPKQILADTPPSSEPYVENPPTYYRSDDWFFTYAKDNLFGGFSGYERREPLNSIVYGPPDGYKGTTGGFNWQMIRDAVREIKVVPRAIAVLPERDVTVQDDHKWLNIQPPEASWDSPFGSKDDCVFRHKWSPLQSSPPDDLPEQVAAYATTNCPAVFGYFELPPNTAEPEFVAGVRERNRFRIWDYAAPNGVNAAYIATSNEENFAIPGRCERSSAHCVTDMNDSRDELTQDIATGATNLGWKVVKGQYDLTNQYTYQNIEPGPYDFEPDEVLVTGAQVCTSFPTAPPGSICTVQPNENGWYPPRVDKRGTTTQRGSWSADGRMAVICIDKNNTDYCNYRPAERPMTFEQVAPLNGKEVDAWGKRDFGLTINYSDLTRKVQSVNYQFSYPATDGTTATVTQLANRQTPDEPAATSQWLTQWQMPSNIQFDPQTGTATLKVDIKACDNKGQLTGNADDTACWTYKNLTYILRNTAKVLIVRHANDTASDATGITLRNWLNETPDKYVVDEQTQVTAADLTNVSVLVLVLPDAGYTSIVQDFLRQGRSVLLIGEHPKYQQMNDSTRNLAPLISTISFDTNAYNGLKDCSADNQAFVRDAALGLALNSPVNVAGVGTLSGGTGLIQTTDNKSIVATDTFGQGRVAVASDTNIWARCGYSNNKPFTNALFAWLSRRS